MGCGTTPDLGLNLLLGYNSPLDISSITRYNGSMMIKKDTEMSALTEYTLEIYKTDRRTKEGQRLVEVKDFDPVTKDFINTLAEQKRQQGFIVKVVETYVIKKSLMSGKEFKERYDTPYFCSPASESYWSM
jgi:hypothetical protein